MLERLKKTIRIHNQNSCPAGRQTCDQSMSAPAYQPGGVLHEMKWLLLCLVK